MSKQITLDIGATPDELGRIQSAVEQLAESEDWPPDLAFQITLVLEELEMNIIHHAYETGGSGAGKSAAGKSATGKSAAKKSPGSRIVLDSNSDRLSIEVIDEGKPFNPLEEAEQPDLDASLKERKVGGLGLHLVRNLMDEISYRREAGKNRLTLVKFRKPR